MAIQLIRTLILYLLVIAGVRLMGKRQLGELTPTELVVALMISDLAAVPMQDLGTPLIIGIIPIIVLVTVEILFSVLLLKFRPLRTLLSGKPVPIIRNGQIDQQGLKDLRQTVDDLLEELRLKDAFDLNSVIFAQVETNGKLSVLVSGAAATAPSYILITDGVLEQQALENSGHTRSWLDDQLQQRGCDRIEDVFLFTVSSQGQISFQRKEELS